MLERPDLHGESRPLRHVLDARPVVLGPALVRQGNGDRVHASLAYALDTWTRRRSHITTTIHYFDRPGDVYEYGVDSLPLFLAALRAADATDLVERYADWLRDEVAHFCGTCR